jgi:hypothetical protein
MNVQNMMLDGDNEPIATFAVPPGFIEALRQAEAAALEQSDTTPEVLQ